MMDGKLIALVLLTALSSAHAFELTGFKGVKFGSDQQALEAQGLQCKVGGEQYLQCAGNDTIFGFESSVRAILREDKVIQIRVVALDSKPLDLIGAFTKALGKPKQFTEHSGKHDLTTHYWVAKDGTSVSTFGTLETLVTKNSDTGEERHFASADYLGKEPTLRLLVRARRAEQVKRDF